MPDAPEQQENHDELIDQLLALPDRDSGADLLRHRGLLDAEGLDALLDRADDLLDSDPGKARKLAELCMGLAEYAYAPAATPKANYVIAGAYDLNGDFVKALELTRLAHDGYVRLGMELEALKTEVGKMRVLFLSGDYELALKIGSGVIYEVDRQHNHETTSSDSEKQQIIAAQVHQNSGPCYEFLGRYKDALRSYSYAERIYASLKMDEELNLVSSNKAIVLMDMGHATEALEILSRKVRPSQGTKLTLSQARDVINLGYAHLLLGNYSSCLRCFEQSRRILEPLDAFADESGLLLDTAGVYLELNLIEEALSSYREARFLLSDSGAVHEQAVAARGLGAAYILRGEFLEAKKFLQEAADYFESMRNVPFLIDTLLINVGLLSLLDEKEAAWKMAVETLELVASSGQWPLQSFYTHLKMAELSLPDTEIAESHLDSAKTFLEDILLPQVHYRFDECLGNIRSLQGNVREAELLFEKSISEIERVYGTVTQDAMRASFLSGKTSVYESLLRLVLHEEGNPLRAFDVSERSKSRSLSDLIVGTNSWASTATEESEAGVQIKAIQADLNAVYNKLLNSAGTPEEGQPPMPDLRHRAAQLEAEISLLGLRIDTHGVETSDPFQATAVRESFSDRLPPDTVLLAYHSLGDEILVFILSRNEIRVERHIGSVAKVCELLRRLDSQWDRFRAGQDFSGRQMATLEKSTQRILTAFYEETIRPVELLIDKAVKSLHLEEKETPKLVIVPHGPLHQAPFHAFFDGERYLLDKFEVSYAPSATVFALCQEKEDRPLDRAVTVGVSDELILTAEDEASAVAGLFPESEVLLDERATSKALEEAVAGCGVLHVACHGMFRSDNPMFSALKLHEDWLLAHDAMGLDLDGAIVALSACESGRNVVVGGDEILGLTRAFLGAGAATLLVSLWIVHDDTTPDLMSRFYERLISGVSPARALRSAQLETREKHPHPYYWAPFVAVGKR